MCLKILRTHKFILPLHTISIWNIYPVSDFGPFVYFKHPWSLSFLLSQQCLPTGCLSWSHTEHLCMHVLCKGNDKKFYAWYINSICVLIPCINIWIWPKVLFLQKSVNIVLTHLYLSLKNINSHFLKWTQTDGKNGLKLWLQSYWQFQQINKGIKGNELSSFLIAFQLVSILLLFFCYYAVKAI